MKKVGIITMHRVQNYGSALQAYALQAYISKQGYAAELIDYIYPNAKHKQRVPLKKRIKHLLFELFFARPLRRKSGAEHPGAGKALGRRPDGSHPADR